MPEILNSLSKVEQMLCSRFGRVETRGKKGRTVPILLTPEMQKSIEILLKYREEAGVNIDNNFVFARPNGQSMNPIRMADALRTFRSNLNLLDGDCLTSTRLRKHVATVAQLLNLSRFDMEVMADFLGHDIEVHRSFYRLPQSTIQVAKMGKLLTALNNGTISKYSGLSLDEISLDEEISSDEDAEENDNDEGEQEIENATSHVVNKDNSTESHLVDARSKHRCSTRRRRIPSQQKQQSEGTSIDVFNFSEQQTSSSDSLSGAKSSPREVQCQGSISSLQKTIRENSSVSKKQEKKIQKLTSEQSQLLRNLFKANITLRRELKMIDCINVIKKHQCLQDLKWTKIKNTIHNWITIEKRKMKNF